MCNPSEESPSTPDAASTVDVAAPLSGAVDPGSDDGDEVPREHPSSSYGSSVGGAIFNFTNCIVGAGAIGLGGAFADSGGAISVVTILFFAVLTKLSLDLVVTMSVENATFGRAASYEELGKLALGQPGRIAVLLSKFLYSFGCLVAYIIVVKDNFTPALRHFLYGSAANDNCTTWLCHFLQRDDSEDVVTWMLGCFVILPLCLLRDMTPLSSLGALSISAMAMIVGIVFYIYVDEPDVRQKGGTVYQNWFEIRPGYIESWGTFVFTFVSQHTVNLAFESLKPEIRTVESWKRVSKWSLTIATSISLTIGVVVYMTFWDKTQSDLFEMYPQMKIVDFAKLLLCITMLLTFPLPFFSCRELLIVSIIRPLVEAFDDDEGAAESVYATAAMEGDTSESDLEEPLLPQQQQQEQQQSPAEGTLQLTDSNSVEFEDPRERSNVLFRNIQSIYNGTAEAVGSVADITVMVPGEEKQLALPFHLAISTLMWGLTTFLAIVSPNLGDILDLVGAASGTAMAFILPGLLSFRLQGYTHMATFILLVGGAIGLVGTAYSVKKLVMDIQS